MLRTEPQEIFLKVANARVRQDKQPPGRLTAGSSRPVTANTSGAKPPKTSRLGDAKNSTNLRPRTPTHQSGDFTKGKGKQMD